jgi:thioredoxin 2
MPVDDRGADAKVGPVLTRTCPKCGQLNRIPVAHLADQGRCGKCKTALPAQPYNVPDVATFDAILREAKVPVLVDFWAEWCAPCRMVAPEVVRAAESLTGKAVVLKVDTEGLPALARRYEATSIPLFVVFRDGTPVLKRPGAVREPELIRYVTGGT